MSGKRAKAIRKKFFGKASPRARRYFRVVDTGQRVADEEADEATA